MLSHISKKRFALILCLCCVSVCMVSSTAVPAEMPAGEKRVARQPAFSPDARQLVYAVGVSKGTVLPTSYEIWTSNIDGTNARQLTSGHEDGHPRFSPDGRSILFMRDNDVWLIGADGAGLRNVTSTGEDYESGAEFSNDGRSVFFTRQGSEEMTPEDEAFAEEDPEAAAYAGTIDTVVLRNLQDGSERVLLGDEYKAEQVIPNPADDNAVFIIIRRLGPNNKPQFEDVFADRVLAELKLDAPGLRTAYAFEVGAKLSIKKARAGARNVLLEVQKDRAGLPTTYLRDAEGIRALPKPTLFSDISRDGRLISSAGLIFEPRLEDAIIIHDIAAKKESSIVPFKRP